MIRVLQIPAALPRNYLKHSFKVLYHFLLELGVDPLRIVLSIPRFFRYLNSILFFIPFIFASRFLGKFVPFTLYPCIHDAWDESGSASGHYFYQDLIVSNLIFKHKPSVHFDIGSRVDGFIAHLLSFEQTIVIGDIRQLKPFHPLVSFHPFDLLKPIPSDKREKYDSISCLHVIEHIGLGRYGDTLCFDGPSIALRNLVSLMSQDARLYISHPCGPTRIEFNAHWVFSASDFYQLLCKASLAIEKCFFINDDGACDFLEYYTINEIISVASGSYYGCLVWVCKKLYS
jgi:hypothetical protein